MRIVWTKTALREIWRIYTYIAETNPKAATNMAGALLDAGDSLATHPRRGRIVRGTKMRELLSTSPYIIRYRIEREQVVILRVRHAARRPTSP